MRARQLGPTSLGFNSDVSFSPYNVAREHALTIDGRVARRTGSQKEDVTRLLVRRTLVDISLPVLELLAESTERAYRLVSPHANVTCVFMQPKEEVNLVTGERKKGHFEGGVIVGVTGIDKIPTPEALEIPLSTLGVGYDDIEATRVSGDLVRMGRFTDEGKPENCGECGGLAWTHILINGKQCTYAPRKVAPAKAATRRPCTSECRARRATFAKSLVSAVSFDKAFYAEVEAGLRKKAIKKQPCDQWVGQCFGLNEPCANKCPRFPCCAIVAQSNAYERFVGTYSSEAGWQANMQEPADHGSFASASASATNMEM